MTLIYWVLAWLAGIALARAAEVTWWGWLVLIVPLLLGAVIAKRGQKDRKRSIGVTLFGCGIFFALGAARLGAAVVDFEYRGDGRGCEDGLSRGRGGRRKGISV